MLSPVTVPEMLVGISYDYWIIPQAHRIYRYSTSPREYSKVSLFILSQGKAIARNDNKGEILIVTTT